MAPKATQSTPENVSLHSAGPRVPLIFGKECQWQPEEGTGRQDGPETRAGEEWGFLGLGGKPPSTHTSDCTLCHFTSPSVQTLTFPKSQKWKQTVHGLVFPEEGKEIISIFLSLG